MHLHKSQELSGKPFALHVNNRLMVSPAVHHLMVLADDNRELKQIVDKLEIIDIDVLQIPALTKKEE
jgi:hypothetical protein